MTPEWSPSPTDRFPSNTDLSRRGLLRTSATAASTAALAGLAGCFGRDDPAAETDDQSYDVDGKLAFVPAGAGAVGYVHFGDVLADPAVQALVDAQFQSRSHYDYYEGPTSFAEARAQFEDESPVALDEFHEILSFQFLGEASHYQQATVLWTDWAEADAVAAATEFDGRELAKTSHANRTFYEPASEDDHRYGPDPHLGVLGEGRYVFGGAEAVKATLEVAAGDADAVGDPVERGIARAGDGPVQFAIDVPQEQFEDADTSGSGFVPGLLAPVPLVYGVITRDGTDRTLAISFDAESTADAEGIAEALRTSIAQAKESGEGPVVDFFEHVSVEQAGSTATLRASATVGEIEDLATSIAEQTPSSSSSSASGTATPEPPALRLESATGLDVGSDGIGGVSLTLSLGDGADAVDLTEARVVWIDPERGSDYVLYHEDGTVPEDDQHDGRFTTPDAATIESGDGEATVEFDLGEATSDVGAAPVGEPLPAGGRASVHVGAPSGRGVFAPLFVPDELSSESVELGIRRPDEE